MNVRIVRKWLLYSAAALICLALVALLALKWAVARIPQYQGEIKAWVHDQTGFYIRFTSVTPTLRWYGPELYFDQLELRSKDDQRTLAHARGGRIAINLWRLAASGQFSVGRIRVESPELEITRIGPNRFSLASEIEFGQGSGDLRQKLARLPQGRLTIRNASITLRNWNAGLPELKFNSVGLDLARRRDRADFAFDAVMPEQLKGSLNLRIRVENFGGSGPLQWSGAAHAKEASVPGWHRLLPEYSNLVESGVARVDFSAAGRGSDIEKSSLEVTAYQLAVPRAAGGGKVLREVGGVLNLVRAGDRWSLAGHRLRAYESAALARETQFTVSWRADAESFRELNAQFNYLAMDAWQPLIAVLPQKELREHIQSYGLSGEWIDAQVLYARASAASPPQWRVRGRFANLGFAPLGRAPGFHALSGTLAGSDGGGQLELKSPGAQIAWPNEWPQPVRLDALQGSLFWRRTQGGLLWASQNLIAANRDASTKTKFAWEQFDDGRSPQLTLASAVSNVNPTSAHLYLPRQHLSPNALNWLNRAFIAGRIPRADLVLSGPIRQFPFRDGSGSFLARFPVEGMTLDYRESWPRIENLAVDAEFRNQGLYVKVRRGMAGRMAIQAGECSFEDFKTGELKIHVVTHTDAAAAIGFLAASPLDALAEHAFSAVEAGGPLNADVNLFLPFKQFDHRRVLVEAHLDGVALSYRGTKLAATELVGDVSVDGAQVPRAQLRGTAMGGALQVRARAPRAKSDLATQLELRGNFTAEALRNALDLPPSVLGPGRADWRGMVRLAPEPARERIVRLSSNLTGLEFKLPEPFAKPAARALPAFAQFEWQKGGVMLIRAGLNPLLRGIFQLDSTGDATRLTRGSVMFGGDAASLNEARGMSVGGKIDRLDLSGWLAAQPAGRSLPLSDYLHEARVEVGKLNFHGFEFREVSLDLKLGEQAWTVAVDGPNSQGTLRFPRAADSLIPWDLQFSRLTVEQPAEDDPGAAIAAPPGPSDPRALPALRFQAGELIWRDRRIGATDAVISKLGDGVNLDRLTVESPTFRLDAKGSWRGLQAGQGRLEGSLLSTDVQNTLTQLGYADVIRAKSGRLDFDLNWLGPPSAQAVAGLNGRIKLDADKGQVVALNPGAGRVLGLASIATLPRRLSLDFSDLTDKGLAFDNIHGDFDIRNGDAFTDNVLLKGPAAEIGLIGRVGLAKHDFDQTAVVTGNLGGTLPLASAFAAGPVVGAAVLLFSQVFKQPLKGLARGYYRITGSWDNPTVERVKSDEAAAATRH